MPSVIAGEVYLKGALGAVDSQGLLLHGTDGHLVETEGMESAQAGFPDSQRCEIPKRDITWASFSRVGRKGKTFFPELFYLSHI